MQTFAHQAVHHALDIRGDELVLGLAAELRVRHLHGEDAGEAFAEVVAVELHLFFLGDALAFHVRLHDARQRHAEAADVGATIALGNVVRIGEHAFRNGVRPLRRHFHGDAAAGDFFGGGKVEDVIVQWLAGAVLVLHVSFDAAVVLEHLEALVAFVAQFDAHAAVQERQFTQATGEVLEVEHCLLEDDRARLETHAGAAPVRRADFRQRRLRVAVAVFLAVQAAIAANAEMQHFGKRIHHRHAHAMEAARDLVGVLVELAAGMQHRHDDFSGTTPLTGVDVRGDAAPVVLHRHGFVGVYGDGDAVTVAGQRLVDGVVHHLEHHVMQAGAVVRVADVHAGALAHRVQPFQHRDAAGVVVGGLGQRRGGRSGRFGSGFWAG